MASTKTERQKKAAMTALAVGGGAAKAGMALAVGNPLAAAFALFPPLLGVMVPAVLERKKKRVEAWWQWVTESNSADTAIGADVSAQLNDPDVQEVVVAAFREVLEAVAEEALKPIAMLTREYVRAGLKRDRFFRSAGSAFAEMTGAEVLALKQLLYEAENVKSNVHSFHFEIKRGQFGVEMVVGPANAQPGYVGRSFKPPLEECEGLFDLLKRHGIASERSSGSYGAGSDADKLVIQQSVAKRLAGLL